MAGALIGLLVLEAVRDGGGDERPPSRPPTARGPTPRLNPGGYPHLGIVLGIPEGWRATRRRGVVRLAPRDRSAAVTIVTESHAAGAASLARATERALHAAYPGARVTAGGSARLAGLPARSTRIQSPARGRRPALDALVLATRSRWRSYAVTVFGGSPGRVAEARALLGALAFVRPR